MIDQEKVKEAVRIVLQAIGEDLSREGIKDTPERGAHMMGELFCGIGKDPRDELQPIFTEEHEELVLVKDIPFYSMCEHHLLPFLGKAHVAYLPKGGRIVGLSKLARVVEILARRPQMQERLTAEIADMIMDALKPHGVLVVIEAEHLCMTMRGIQKPGSLTVTSAVRGFFRKDAAARAEAFSLINRR